MANPEVALDVENLDTTQRSVATAESVPKDGGDRKEARRCRLSSRLNTIFRRCRLSFRVNTIFSQSGNFLPTWNNVFVASCVFAVSIDPLFFYIPIINEKKKCLYFDTRLKAMALVLRLLTDLFYIADIIVRILTGILRSKSSNASEARRTQLDSPNLKWKTVVGEVFERLAKRAQAKTNRLCILIDVLAILPIPQVAMFIFFLKKKGPGGSEERRLFDTLILFQFVPRVLPVYLLCKGHKRTLNTTSLWIKGVFNFLLYILASHVVGALWYFFAIQREMDCWHSVCQHYKSCHLSAYSCNERQDRLRNIPLLDIKCPTNQPEEKKGKHFDFGIFADALDSGLVQSTDFPQKFLNCFWWGLRNLSSLGQNLQTSTYAWENLFAVFISIIGLLLFIYLIGNLQTYLQFAATISEELRRKMKAKNLEVDLWLARKGLPNNFKEVIMPIIKKNLELNKDVPVEDIILSVLPSAHSIYIKRDLLLDTLKKVPVLQTMGERMLKAIFEHLKQVEYPEDSCIIREGEQLRQMIFITRGTVETYRSDGKGGKKGYEFLEKGDFYGAEELLKWASNFRFYTDLDLPISTRTVKRVTKVEAFSLSADDLKSVAIKYWWNFTKNRELKHFDQSVLEKFARSSIEKEIRRRRQAEQQQAIRSLLELDTNQGSASQKFATTRAEKLRRKMKTKTLEVDLWLSRKGLPSNLKEVIMPDMQQKLEQNIDVPVEDILSVLPSAHSKYIKRYLRLAALKKVPMFQTMEVRMLKAICEHLEPVDYPQDSCIIRERERLHQMIFITYGTVQTYKTNGKGGKIGSKFLERGDFYGAEELLKWASNFSAYQDLPISFRMAKAVTKVEAFSLSADDLKSVAIKYWWNFTKDKELKDFHQSVLEEFAVSSIEKEIRRRRQVKKRQTIRSLQKLDTNQGSTSQKLQKVISMVMRDQLPSPICALDGR